VYEMVEFVDDDYLKSLYSNGVHVVGNALSLRSKNYGELIDSNLTIRFNWPILDASTGYRMDAIFTSNTKKIPKNYAFDLLFTRHYKDPHNNKKQYTVEGAFITKLKTGYNLDKKPSNGLLCLYLLDVLGIENVGIFGFDWKETPSTTKNNNFMKTATAKNDPWHNYYKEKEVALDMIKKNCWKLYK